MGAEVPPRLPRRRGHRLTFAAAGFYNLAWGALAALDPQHLSRFAGMPPLEQPAVFACLGMVVGIYGLLYLEVARRPERGFAIAAVGLLGKLLGPAGMAHLVWTGRWPPAALWLSFANDLVWWAPFIVYLRDSWPLYRRTWTEERP
jgi:hypothetical protein